MEWRLAGRESASQLPCYPVVIFTVFITGGGRSVKIGRPCQALCTHRFVKFTATPLTGRAAFTDCFPEVNSPASQLRQPKGESCW